MVKLLAAKIALTDAVKKLLVRREGASMVEYALLVALIAVVSIGTLTAIGLALKDKFVQVETALGGGAGG